MAESAIVKLFEEIGIGLNSLIRSEMAVYGLFVVSTFFILYLMVKGALTVAFKNHKGMNNKSVNVLSFFVGLISTPAIFWGKSTADVINFLSNGFVFFLTGLSCLAVIGLVVWYYWFKKPEKDKFKTNTKVFVTSLVVFAMAGMFSSVIEGRVGSISTLSEGFGKTIAGIVKTSSTLAFAVFFFSALVWIGSMFDFMGIGASNKHAKNPHSSAALASLLKSLKQDYVNLGKKIEGLKNLLQAKNRKFGGGNP